METIKHPEHVLAYNGEIIVFQTSQLKDAVSTKEQNALQFSRRKFHADSGTFTEISFGQYIIQTRKYSVDFVCANCVTDVKTGLKLPCILLKTYKRKQNGQSRLILLQIHHSNEVDLCLKVKVDTESIEDLRLIDGPTILWRQNEKIFYISPVTSERLTAPMNIAALYWAGGFEDGTCIFGATTKSEENLPRTSHPERTFHGGEFVLYNIEKQTIFSGSCLVPHAYTSVLRCLEVFTMRCVDGTYETSCVGASHKQLIWFENGIPNHVWQIPNENLLMLQVAYTSQAHTLCVLSFASGDVCAVRKDDLQVIIFL